jgi:hypothetical protein
MIAYPPSNVYSGLLYLLAYAHTHRHSHQWVAPLMNILRRGGVAHA